MARYRIAVTLPGLNPLILSIKPFAPASGGFAFVDRVNLPVLWVPAVENELLSVIYALRKLGQEGLWLLDAYRQPLAPEYAHLRRPTVVYDDRRRRELSRVCWWKEEERAAIRLWALLNVLVGQQSSSQACQVD